MIRASRVTSTDVINHPVAIDKGAVHGLIAQIGQADPTVDVGLRQPEIIGAECGGADWIAKVNDAFASRRIVVRSGRKFCGSSERIRGLDIECNDSSSSPARN